MVGFDIDPVFADDYQVRINREGSYSERYESAKLVTAASALLFVDLVRRRMTYGFLGVSLLYLAVDNKYGLHEAAGRWIAPNAIQVGELIYMLVVASVLLAGFLISIWRASSQERTAILAILGGVGLLAAFAVGVDFLHATFMVEGGSGDLFFVLWEDGGELIAITAIAVAVWHIVRPQLISLTKRVRAIYHRSEVPIGSLSDKA